MPEIEIKALKASANIRAMLSEILIEAVAGCDRCVSPRRFDNRRRDASPGETKEFRRPPADSG